MFEAQLFLQPRCSYQRTQSVSTSVITMATQLIAITVD